MPTGLSARLAAVVDALPLEPHSRVLEIGCRSGAAARAVVGRLTTGHVLAIDRSARAIAGAAGQLASGQLRLRQVAAEDFVLEARDEPFDIVFAVRVGALDGRHPTSGKQVLRRIPAATAPGARLFTDGGHPLRELTIPPAAGTAPHTVAP